MEYRRPLLVEFFSNRPNLRHSFVCYYFAAASSRKCQMNFVPVQKLRLHFRPESRRHRRHQNLTAQAKVHSGY